MNQQAMLKKLKKLQDEMVATQKEIETTIFRSSAGGVVSVELWGTKEIKSIEIADSFTIEGPEDREILNDMLVSACNNVYRDIDKTTKERMEKYNSLLQMGGLF